MAAVTAGGSGGVVPPREQSVTVVTLADVPPVELAGGSWSRVLVADKTVSGNATHSAVVWARRIAKDFGANSPITMCK